MQRRGSSAIFRAMTEWPVLLALGLWAVNDHALKGRALSLLTGKLSDVAGLFVFPVFLACVLRLCFSRTLKRVSDTSLVLFGAATTGLVFFGINFDQVANEAFYRAFSIGPLHLAGTADPTDLLCLPVILLSVYIVQRKTRRSRTAKKPGETRVMLWSERESNFRASPGRHGPSRVLLAFVLCLVFLTTVATSVVLLPREAALQVAWPEDGQKFQTGEPIRLIWYEEQPFAEYLLTIEGNTGRQEIAFGRDAIQFYEDERLEATRLHFTPAVDLDPGVYHWRLRGHGLTVPCVGPEEEEALLYRSEVRWLCSTIIAERTLVVLPRATE